MSVKHNWGGFADTAALSGAALTAASTSPIIYENVTPYGVMSAAALSGTWIANRLAGDPKDKFVFKSNIKAYSDKPYIKAELGEKIKDAFLFGYTVDRGEPFWVHNEELMRHVYIRGQSGVGKTVLAETLIFQQIARGGGLLFVDGKIDSDNLEKLWQMAAWAGRENDLEVINPGNPELSNTYNPILFGDPDEVASRIMGLIPSTESNAGSDHYKQSGNQAITTIVSALKAAGIAYTFMDLTIMLMSPKAMDNLLKAVPPNSHEANELKVFLSQYRTNDGQINMHKMKEIFGGLGGRMHQFGSGRFGQITNTYNPEVVLYNSILNNKITYVALPTMAKDIAANNFGKMLVGDLRTAIAWLQALPKSKRPWPPYTAFLDEAGSYAAESWDRMFEQGRSAHVSLIPMVQTDSNFKSISEELSEMIEGNTWTKVYFKLGSQSTAEAAAEYIGTYRGAQKSLSTNWGETESADLREGTPSQGTSDSTGLALQEREEERYRITDEELKGLSKGEALLVFGENHSIYPIKIPLIAFDKEYIEKVGPVQINRPFLNQKRPVKPYKTQFDLINRVDELLSPSQKKELQKQAKQAIKALEEDYSW